jgi:type I restriction enzyme, S subunit
LSNKANRRFLNQIFATRRWLENVSENSGGTTHKRISRGRLAKLVIPLPSLIEQDKIASALCDADELSKSLEKIIEKKRNIKHGAMQKLLEPKDDWVVKKLGEVAEIVGGGTPSTLISNYWNGDINWFTPTEIGINKYTYESIRKISKDGLKNCSGRILPKGTILLTTRAGIGDLSILMKEGCTNQGFQSLIVKESYNNEYFYYLLQTLKSVLIQNASGSTFLEISPNKLKQIQVSLPSFSEQYKIAMIISDMDNEINSLEKKLSKLNTIKQGMMQNLLTGKIRLV